MFTFCDLYALALSIISTTTILNSFSFHISSCLAGNLHTMAVLVILLNIDKGNGNRMCVRTSFRGNMTAGDLDPFCRFNYRVKELLRVSIGLRIIRLTWTNKLLFSRELSRWKSLQLSNILPRILFEYIFMTLSNDQPYRFNDRFRLWTWLWTFQSSMSDERALTCFITRPNASDFFDTESLMSIGFFSHEHCNLSVRRPRRWSDLGRLQNLWELFTITKI